jgi:inward rectifier potassium channel
MTEPEGEARPSKQGLARNVRPDGSLVVERIGVRQSPVGDLYHFLFTTSWTRLLGVFVLIWLGLNGAFAFLYLAGGSCIEGAEAGSFKDAFNFSVQTMATIGYGGMSPRTDWAHLLVAAEAIVGILVTAMSTGVVFAKFARPTARVLFSNQASICSFDGRRALVFRVANARDSHLVEAFVHVAITLDEPTSEGQPFRRLYDLKLRRDTSPIFALSWTVIHFIDEDSPLFGLSLADLEAREMTILATLRGTDEVLVQSVHARHAYGWYDLVWDRSFVDVFTRSAEGTLRLDYTKFHDTVPQG